MSIVSNNMIIGDYRNLHHRHRGVNNTNNNNYNENEDNYAVIFTSLYLLR